MTRIPDNGLSLEVQFGTAWRTLLACHMDYPKIKSKKKAEFGYSNSYMKIGMISNKNLWEQAYSMLQITSSFNRICEYCSNNFHTKLPMIDVQSRWEHQTLNYAFFTYRILSSHNACSRLMILSNIFWGCLVTVCLTHFQDSQ